MIETVLVIGFMLILLIGGINNAIEKSQRNTHNEEE